MEEDGKDKDIEDMQYEDKGGRAEVERRRRTVSRREGVGEDKGCEK